MNKKKLYNSIMESVSKELHNILLFNDSDIFNREDSYYDYDEKGSLVYRNIENKINNTEKISKDESDYFFKVNPEKYEEIINKLKYGEIEKNQFTNIYKVSSKEELREIIENYSKKNPNVSLNWIDTSLITDMSELFAYTDYNGDISEWDTSNVTDMHGMFWLTLSFNQPIGNWDVNNVTNMSCMFNNAISFNQPIGDWDVRNVINMKGMFEYAKKFNKPISGWDVSNVTDMRNMFRGAKNFNQYIINWNVSNTTKINLMFDGCPIQKEYKPIKLKNR